MSDPTPLDVERCRRIARNALNTWVGRNWPSMDEMRQNGIGVGLVEKSGKPDQAIRRFLDTFQPDFVLDLLDRLAALAAAPASDSEPREDDDGRARLDRSLVGHPGRDSDGDDRSPGRAHRPRC